MSLLERMSKGSEPEPSPQQPQQRPGAAPPPGEPPRQPRGPLKPELLGAKAKIHAQLVELSAARGEIGEREEVQKRINELADAHLRQTGLVLTRRDFETLVDSLLDDVLGLGPLEALLND